MKASLLIPVLVAGCFAQAQSSRSVLGPSDSEVALRTAPDDTAREVLRLLGNRGYHLIDHQTRSGTLVLKLTGNREADAEGKYWTTTQYGSVFYVWISPDATGSRVAMVGAPIVDGAEACTDPPTGMPCDNVLVPIMRGGHINGVDEANVIHGVYSELALEQIVIAQPVGPQPAISLTEQCRQRRIAFAFAAGKERDPETRARILADAPKCE